MRRRRFENRGRDINGLLLLDKPPGMSSNEALQQVKRLYGASKAGHTGSLDPLASGLLPICFGQATKFSQFLLEANKAYCVTAKLGIETTTGDSEGDVVAQRTVPSLTTEQIESYLQPFVGEIEQIPSMYSAIKYHGQPLYKLARQGITVEREPRKITIFKIELLGYSKELMELDISCSKGTYIRTLVTDIGEAIGCGAHVVALRRLSISGLDESQMITLQQLKQLHTESGTTAIDQLLLPVADVVAGLPELVLSEAAVFYLSQGQAIISPYAPESGMVCLKTQDGRFLGVGEILSDGKVAPKKLLIK